MTDRGLRYRARSVLLATGKPERCELCSSTRFLTADHRNGFEEDNRPANLRWLCKSCNTRLGLAFAKAGKGRRTRQFNPGAENLAQYVQAVLDHTRGAHDAGGMIIHETPKEKRQEYAAKIWSRRKQRGATKGEDVPF
jgi:hypothetical protein